MTESVPPLRKKLAQAETTTLALRARQLAAGWAAGTHRAERKGSGVEFAGHRAYTPGDDLRRLDRHALLRHRRLLIREFLTDTERAIHLVVDASWSMSYRGHEPEASRESKAERALLLAAALAFIAKGAGDPIGLTTVVQGEEETFKPRASSEAFDHTLHRLETLDTLLRRSPPSDIQEEKSIVGGAALYHRLGSALPRGTLIFVLSDFLDDQEGDWRALGALCTQRRTVRAAQILTPEEVDFPFEGALRFVDMESGRHIETDGAGARRKYRAAINALTDGVRRNVQGSGGLFLRHLTSEAVAPTLRALAAGQAMDASREGGRSHP